MTFETKYKDTDFLNVLSTTQPCTSAYVMKTLGCARDTAKAYLKKLEVEGKAKKVEVCGGSPLWLKVEESQKEQA
jgi:predicted HTH transcriptional regulator